MYKIQRIYKKKKNTPKQRKNTRTPPFDTTKFQDFSWVQFSHSVCPTLCDPMNRSMPGLPVRNQLPEFTQTHVDQVSDASSHLIPCRPLLLLPSLFPSIRVFSNESALRIKWPKYWSFSFKISPSNEHPGLISFRMDWFQDLARVMKSV